MSSRKTTVFYGLLTAVASLAVGMVLASRLDLSPVSMAQPVINVPAANSAPLAGPLDASTFRNIAKLVSPSVVNIRTESVQRPQELTEFFGGGGDDLLERFFGGQPGGRGQGGQGQGGQGPGGRSRPQVAVAAGTGFIISKDGYILTNNHVVADATKIEVNLFGDDNDITYEARVVGRDPLTDSALIELTEKPGRDLAEVKFGDSALMAPGDWVMAIGNPFSLSHTVSVGVVSAARPGGLPVADGRWADVIQTDAAINPGNSGGPLLNVRGEVIGINTAIYADSRSQGNVGIGFAIPINVVRDLLPQLRGGKITRGVIGVQVTDVPLNALAEFGLKQRRGALVSVVNREGPAARAGLEPGDVIVEYNGKPIERRDQLVSMVVATKPGTTVPVKVLRDKQERSLNVTIDELDLDGETRTTRRDPATPDIEESTGFGGSLGVLTSDMARRLRVPPGTDGVLVSDVEAGSPAQRAGISRGDVILQINRRSVTTPQEAGRVLNSVPSGGTVFLLVLTGGEQRFVTVRKD
ncbi:MAG: trypsin-like peptidase domain-containing protein [Acidobacteria bacterium]|nr:trypsin-like peptidase domain-containing protein [Acidobacteriota bacterium]